MAYGGPLFAIALLRLRHKASLVMLFVTFVIGEARWQWPRRVRG